MCPWRAFEMDLKRAKAMRMRLGASVCVIFGASINGTAQQRTAAPADRPAVTKAQVTQWMKSLSTWGKWGKDDQLGALNYVTPEKRRAAAALVRTGEVVSLELPIFLDQRHPEIARVGRPN